MSKRKPPQLSLFEGLALLVGPAAKERRERQATEDAESARVVRTELAEAAAWCEQQRADVLACAKHGPAYICPACSPSGDTDGSGFLHRQVCRGRIPLRRCRGCQKLRTPGTWNHKDYFHCTDCIPLGSAAVPPDPF